MSTAGCEPALQGPLGTREMLCMSRTPPEDASCGIHPLTTHTPKTSWTPTGEKPPAWKFPATGSQFL